jgi:hypothetical protein
LLHGSEPPLWAISGSRARYSITSSANGKQRRRHIEAKPLRSLEVVANSNLVGWLPITLLAISINLAAAIVARPSAPPSFAE